MMRIGIDLDGTIADSIASVVAILNMNYNLNAINEDITLYNVWENSKFKGATEQDVINATKDAWKDYKSIKLVDQRIPDILGRLGNAFELHCTTATLAEMHEIEGFFHHNKIKMQSIIRRSNPIEKFNSGMNMYVVDCANIVDQAVETGARVVLLKQPWNSRFAGMNGNRELLKIAENWADVEQLVLKEYERREKSKGLIRNSMLRKQKARNTT